MLQNKWIVLLLLLIRFNSYSQQSTAVIPLTTIIQNTEQRYNVKFSYAVEDVKNIRIEAPNASLTFKEVITYLNAKVLLNFKAIDDRYVTVSLLNKTVRVCGTVYSETTKTTLPGASIRLVGSSRGAVANGTGTFTIDNIPLNATIIVSFIGYEDQQFTPKELFSENNNC
ncbi:carboxypeptidase-like regulatory domain-containing protein, partial [Flavobacterium sp.]|uniref:carboxypeptidase-like regulatory domain-containing protein n=1 Tax=Flavobacterium sp. TaxID=239 RepID=UPI00260A7876